MFVLSLLMPCEVWRFILSVLSLLMPCEVWRFILSVLSLLMPCEVWQLYLKCFIPSHTVWSLTIILEVCLFYPFSCHVKFDDLYLVFYPFSCRVKFDDLYLVFYPFSCRVKFDDLYLVFYPFSCRAKFDNYTWSMFVLSLLMPCEVWQLYLKCFIPSHTVWSLTIILEVCLFYPFSCRVKFDDLYLVFYPFSCRVKFDNYTWSMFVLSLLMPCEVWRFILSVLSLLILCEVWLFWHQINFYKTSASEDASLLMRISFPTNYLNMTFIFL